MENSKIVYHYCSTDVFMKIISNKTLRLSNIVKSNDSMEIMWITKYVKEVFDKAFNKESTKYFKNAMSYDEFEKEVNYYSNIFFKEDQKPYEFFVCCFSKYGDLLSQWRGYADDATGISIGFDINQLINKKSENKILNYNNLKYDEIIYKETNQKSKIKKIAEKLIKDLKNILKKENVDKAQRTKEAFYNCFQALSNLAVFMKNPFFNEEKESRICYRADIDNKSNIFNQNKNVGLMITDINFASKKNDFVTFVDLSFKGMEKSIIKEVIIGPKCKASESDVINILKLNGIECEVRKSNGTYR